MDWRGIKHELRGSKGWRLSAWTKEPLSCP